MKLYHITPIKNIDSIIENGIKTKDGFAYLFENTTIPYCEGFYRRDKWSSIMRDFSIRDIIAKNELFLKEYALFEVDVEGLDLVTDVCGEITYKQQYKTTTDIPKEKVTYIGTYKTQPYYNFPRLKTIYRPKGKIIHLDKTFGWVEAAA